VEQPVITVGKLYLVATPIGNLQDISQRALSILSQVSLIAAEDTRQTLKLLRHYNIHAPMVSYHEHNKLARVDQILAALEQGDVALVSDAGTPALNDPGYELVRAALQAGHTVSPIPGPSAPLAALVASGLPTDAFLYLGYLPRKPGERRELLGEVSALPYTLIFLETPHRLLNALQDLQHILGDRSIAVARELTKLHEEIYRGPVSQALVHYSAQPPRGEITLVVAGAAEPKPWDEGRLRAALRQRLAAGEAASQAAGELALLSGWPRRKIYSLWMENQTQEEAD
jgi:16S rRNA (cytidine1402-2'-O)-methyltransferase